MHIVLKCVVEHEINYCDNFYYLSCEKNDIVICDSFVILKDQTLGFGKNTTKNTYGLFLINKFVIVDSTNVVNKELLKIILKNQSNITNNQKTDIPGILHRISKKSVGVISLCFNCGENLMGPRQEFIHCTVCNQIFHEICHENHKFTKKCHRNLKNTNMECVASLKAANVLVSDWSNKEIIQWLCSVNFFRLIDLFENKNITGKDILAQMPKNSDELNSIETSNLTFWTQIADSFYRQALYEAFKTLLEPNSDSIKEYNKCDNAELSDSKINFLDNVDESSPTEKYIINVSNHKLRETSYTENIICCYCNKFLLGLQKQGYHCIKCQRNYHKVCSFQNNIQKCTENDISNEQNVSNSSIFGVSISEQKLCSNGVPLFIKCCLEELERRFISNNSGKKLLDTYSQTATTNDTIYLKTKFSHPIFNEESDIVGLTEISDIYLAKLIKLYFKELPEPLLTYYLYHSLVESANEEEDKICCSRIHSILSELPSPNKQTLRFLMKHFELICSNIWDNSNKLKIVSKKWSLIFSKTLIWPPQIMVNQFPVLKSRHQRIIQLVFEYKLVLLDRFTWPLLSVHEENMSLSHSLNRIQLSCLQTAIEELNNDITSQEWYWGNTSKEEVNEYMAGLQDGYFLVRDSSDKTLGMYTLTIRKEGENKLVRIICRDGLYGFQEPCQFESVPKLIKYYQSHKLSEYNDQLNIMLRFSCSKGKSDVKGNVNELYQLSNDDLIQLLIKTMNDIFNLNSKVEEATNTYNENQKQLDEVTKVLKGIDRIRLWCDSHVTHIMNINNSIDKSAWIDHSRKCLLQLNTKLKNCAEVTKEMKERREKLITESDELHSQLQMDRPELKRQNRLQAQIIRLFKDRGVPDEIFSSETVESSFDNLRDNEKLPESTKMDHKLTLNIRQALNVNNPINIKSNWFLADIERNESIALLSQKQHGTFLIRKSREPGNYALDINVNGTIQHCKIFCQNGKYGFIKNDCLFQNLEELVKTFHICSLSKYNSSLTTNLTYPVNM